MDIPRPSSTKRHGLSMLLGARVEDGDQVEPIDRATGARELLELPLDAIERNEAQPRTSFDQVAIGQLAESIEANGVIQPIAVRETGAGRYEIIAGERRWLAARRAGLGRIPAVVHEVDDRETLVLALVENVVRQDLNPLETARAYAALQDEFGMSTAELARSVGKSRPAVANTLRLLELPDDVLDMVEGGRIAEGHARALLGCSDRVRQLRLARMAIDRSLTVRALEALVREGEEAGGTRVRRRTKWNREPAPELQGRVERLAEGTLGARARLRMGDGGGKLELHVDSPAELVALVDQLEQALGGAHAAAATLAGSAPAGQATA